MVSVTYGFINCIDVVHKHKHIDTNTHTHTRTAWSAALLAQSYSACGQASRINGKSVYRSPPQRKTERTRERETVREREKERERWKTTRRDR